MQFIAHRLARERRSLAGTFDPATSARLEDRLAEWSPGTGVTWRITGTTDALGRPALAIEVSGVVPLECQRCLKPLAWTVDQTTLLALAGSEDEADALDAESDGEVVLAAGPLDPIELVEDELLLTLPYAPTHPVGECTAPLVQVPVPTP
ncbi:MAG: YceD family protein [Casimicrobiaceae bacterium]